MRAERTKTPQGRMRFRTGHFSILLVFGLTTIGCGGALRQVQGAKFALNGQEESIAEEYSQGDPVSADSNARCEYWKGRTGEAGHGHAVGVLVWRADHFQTLKSWTNAKAVEVCTLAKAEQKRQEEVATREREAAAKLVRQEEERHASEQRDRQAARDAAARLAKEAEAGELTKRMAEQRRVSDVASLGSLESGLASFGPSPKWTNDNLDRMVELSRISVHLSAADASLMDGEKARLAIATKAMGNLMRSQSYIKASAADRARQQALEARRQQQKADEERQARQAQHAPRAEGGAAQDAEPRSTSDATSRTTASTVGASPDEHFAGTCFTGKREQRTVTARAGTTVITIESNVELLCAIYTPSGRKIDDGKGKECVVTVTAQARVEDLTLLFQKNGGGQFTYRGTMQHTP